MTLLLFLKKKPKVYLYFLKVDLVWLNWLKNYNSINQVSGQKLSFKNDVGNDRVRRSG
jgi:hypothetical protein